MIRVRVNQVLADWCGEAPVDQGTSLETQWLATRNDSQRPHNGMEYQLTGVQDLLTKLTSEFSKPDHPVDPLKSTSVLSKTEGELALQGRQHV